MNDRDGAIDLLKTALEKDKVCNHFSCIAFLCSIIYIIQIRQIISSYIYYLKIFVPEGNSLSPSPALGLQLFGLMR